MAEELANIDKPGLAQFQGKRKLYLIPLIYAGTDAPPEFKEKYQRFWQQVTEQITAQESKVGKINRIYHETISVGGENGLNIMEHLNILSYTIVKDKMDKGAAFEAVEEMTLVDECMDWERCLMIGLYSQKVAETVSRAYHESATKRFAHISHRIDESLQENEVALLFIREGHAVQFPKDVDVFIVAPPALDEINRWLRDRQKEPAQTDESEKKTAE